MKFSWDSVSKLRMLSSGVVEGLKNSSSESISISGFVFIILVLSESKIENNISVDDILLAF